MKKTFLIIMTALLTMAPAASDAKAKKKKVAEPQLSTLELIEKVNNKWQADNKAEADASPMTAKYQLANMRVYSLTQNARYLEYADKWARHNKFTCDEKADEKLAKQCFMVYRQLNAVAPAKHKLQLKSRIKGCAGNGSCSHDTSEAECLKTEKCGKDEVQKSWEQMIKSVAADGTIMTDGCKTCATVSFLNAACDQLIKENNLDSKASFTVIVNNSEKRQRNEVVELCADSVAAKLGISRGRLFRVVNAVGKEVPYQLTYDGKVLIEATVRPNGTAQFMIEKGIPQIFPAVAYGRMYPERVDDIAWENDRSAYRCYGPALQRTGETSYGNDVWVKNIPSLVNEDRYYMEDVNNPVVASLRKTDPAKAHALEMKTSYHYDQGNGLDCYKVGPTLGCGTPALIDGDNITFPYCYSDYELLDNGPLRFTVHLKYNPLSYHGDDNVVEHRILSLDKGSNFNKMVVWYENLTKPVDVASGVVIHTEDTENLVLGKNYVQYADPTDNPDGQNFQIFVAAIFPQEGVQTRFVPYSGTAKGVSGHALGILKNYSNGECFTYYFGSAWSKYDCYTQNEWQLRVDSFISSLATPLKVEY